MPLSFIKIELQKPIIRFLRCLNFSIIEYPKWKIKRTDHQSFITTAAGQFIYIVNLQLNNN
jgi:hypothetical protein